jgi:hypothetical protein
MRIGINIPNDLYERFKPLRGTTSLRFAETASKPESNPTRKRGTKPTTMAWKH